MIGVSGMKDISLPGVLMLRNEWKLNAALMGSSPFTLAIPEYAGLYLQGALDLDSMIAERIGLGDINAGYDTMQRGAQARSVITFKDAMREAAV